MKVVKPKAEASWKTDYRERVFRMSNQELWDEFIEYQGAGFSEMASAGDVFMMEVTQDAVVKRLEGWLLV